MERVLVINGPNLNLLGTREPEIYGAVTLPDLEQLCGQWGREVGVDIRTFQSNHEGAIIDAIHGARSTCDGIVINPGAFTHYSYAIHDAILGAGLPTVEVHISNVRERETWRRISVVEPACLHQIFGRGVEGYRWAIHHLVYRAAMPFETLGPGDHPDKVGDLRLPVGTGPHPVAVLYHGGFWREHWTRDLMDGLAVDLVGRGFATWNVEYRRIPPIGGWRDTVADATEALDAVAPMAEDRPLDPERVTLIGHSAGAQLAMVAAASADRVRPGQVVSLAGVLDLAALYDPEDGNNGPARLVGADGPAAFASTSPIDRVPLGIPQLVVHGDADDAVPVAVSRRYAQAARAASDDVNTLWLDGVGHMDLIDPASPAWLQVADLL